MKYTSKVMMLLVIFVLPFSCTPDENSPQPIIFATFTESKSDLSSICITVKSIRAFAGKYNNAPVWVYMPETLMAQESETLEKLVALNVVVKTSEAPDTATWFYFARKVFAAAQAEAEAEGHTAILAWLDPDTIFLLEPDEFILPKSTTLGYRPVMHKNIGLLYTEPLDEFWSRAYEKMNVDENTLFPMITPADVDTIRPYFNAGCLIVKPHQSTLRKWADYFTILYQDSVLAELCRQDIYKRIFIHQAALTGAILNHVDREKMLQLSDRINYPIFFQEMFGAKRVFNDITNVVTFRYESYFRNPVIDWYEQLNGPADRIEWMKKNLDKRFSIQ